MKEKQNSHDLKIPNSNLNESTKLPSLNGLRAISILLVIIHHIGHNKFFNGYEYGTIIRGVLSFLQDGQLGVNIFFVISGFLITTLLIREEKLYGKINLKSFYIRRSLRIFPVYYFVLLTYFILQILSLIEISNLSWFTSLTYTKYFNRGSDLYTGHFWSLCVEEHFYIFWPIAFMFGKKIRKYLAFFLILIVPIIKLISFYFPVSWVHDLTILTRIDAIAFGCLVSIYKDYILSKLEKYWKYIIYISLGSLFILHFLPSNILDYNHFAVIKSFGTAYGSIANIFIALLILYSIYGPKKLWYKFLNLKIMNHIGILSYSLYLWQQIVIFEPFHFNFNPFVTVILIYLVAFTSYYFIEKQFLKLKSKFSG